MILVIVFSLVNMWSDFKNNFIYIHCSNVTKCKLHSDTSLSFSKTICSTNMKGTEENLLSNQEMRKQKAMLC